MPEFDTETVTPDAHDDARASVPGGVLIFTEGTGALRRPLALREPFTVGREGDFVLDDRKASRQHARFEPAAQGVFVTDLESRNGVLVDGQPIAERTYAPAGASIRVGNSFFIASRHVESQRREPDDVPGILGGSALDGVRGTIRRAATRAEPVLILGENGVGKELVARALHDASGRAGSLVTVNCAAIPAELIESELFGHRRGAFSGADADRPGLMRAANDGSLFLDEIGEMPLAVQAKLLRALDRGEVRPVGEDAVVEVSVRFLSATNVDLAANVEAGTFREDLYHRVATHVVTVPPLRERRDDIPQLFAHFAADADATISADAMQKLLLWPWSGNVRELRNVVRQAVSGIDDDRVVRLLNLPEALRAAKPRESVEHHRLVAALEAAGGNVAAAARDMGMRRATLHERLKRLGIDPAAYRR